MINDIYGLSNEEVNSRIQQGLINKDTAKTGRSVKSIIKSNTFTLFNGINIVLAALVLIAGSPKNMLFAGVILTNTLTGIYQELKARKTLNDLAILNKRKVKVLRNNEKIYISPEDIVIDDIVVLETGVQVPVDGKIITNSHMEVDTSALTGEFDPVSKTKDDFIYSGSIIVSGYCYIKAEKIGDDRYMLKLSIEAKQFKISNSELKNSIDRIIRYLIKIIVPLGAMLMISQMFFANKPWRDALISAVAGIISMIPEGLVLITTLSFLLGVIRLAKWNTLVQELPATEILARVDTLCLDKTGTLTKGNLKLSEAISLNESEDLNRTLSIVSRGFDVANQTQNAIIEYAESMNLKHPDINFTEIIPFNSYRKWSALRLHDNSIIFTGAPEIFLKEDISNAKALSDNLSSSGKRTLVLAVAKGSPNMPILEKQGDKTSSYIAESSAVGLLVFEDEIRDSANSTIDYFKKQGVNIVILSGDNPKTVSNIAKAIGIENYENYIDASDLPEDKNELKKLLLDVSIFGRVTPYDKRDIVEALQEMGRTVAMTGDGINDVLALKKADCAIGLANGTDAAKAVSHIVLLDEDFSNLTHVVDEGRRITNNLERTAGLYLSKTIYSIILSLFFALTTLPYPFIPIQLTLIGGLTIGIPSFFLALESNNSKVNKGFLKRVLFATIPRGVTVALFAIICFSTGYLMSIDLNITRTFTTFIVGGIGLVILAQLSSPLNKMRLSLLLVMTSAFVIPFLFPIGRRVFSLYKLPIKYFGFATILVIAGYFTIEFLQKLLVCFESKRHKWKTKKYQR